MSLHSPMTASDATESTDKPIALTTSAPEQKTEITSTARMFAPLPSPKEYFITIESPTPIRHCKAADKIFFLGYGWDGRGVVPHEFCLENETRTRLPLKFPFEERISSNIFNIHCDMLIVAEHKSSSSKVELFVFLKPMEPEIISDMRDADLNFYLASKEFFVANNFVIETNKAKVKVKVKGDYKNTKLDQDFLEHQQELLSYMKTHGIPQRTKTIEPKVEVEDNNIFDETQFDKALKIYQKDLASRGINQRTSDQDVINQLKYPLHFERYRGYKSPEIKRP